MDELTANWDKYIADLTTTLNELPSDAYSPTLTALDQVMESVTVSQSVNTLLPGVLGNLAYTLTLTNEPAQFVDGKYEDTEAQINASLSVLNPDCVRLPERRVDGGAADRRERRRQRRLHDLERRAGCQRRADAGGDDAAG